MSRQKPPGPRLDLRTATQRAEEYARQADEACARAERRAEKSQADRPGGDR